MNNEALLATMSAFFLAAGGTHFFVRRRRSDHTRTRFGTLYRSPQRDGGAMPCRSAPPRKEVEPIIPLVPEDVSRFRASWSAVQAQMPAEPEAAVAEANRLIEEVMSACGFRSGESIPELSADHVGVVVRFRIAQLTARQAQWEGGAAGWRKAMVHYRALFHDLVGEPDRFYTIR